MVRVTQYLQRYDLEFEIADWPQWLRARDNVEPVLIALSTDDDRERQASS